MQFADVSRIKQRSSCQTGVWQKLSETGEPPDSVRSISENAFRQIIVIHFNGRAIIRAKPGAFYALIPAVEHFSE